MLYVTIDHKRRVEHTTRNSMDDSLPLRFDYRSLNSGRTLDFLSMALREIEKIYAPTTLRGAKRSVPLDTPPPWT